MYQFICVQCGNAVVWLLYSVQCDKVSFLSPLILPLSMLLVYALARVGALAFAVGCGPVKTKKGGGKV